MATRVLFDIVYDGTLEELRQALPSDQKKRKAAVCVFHPEAGVSLLTNACWLGRWDMAAALVQEHGHPVGLAEPKHGNTALHQVCFEGGTEAALFLIRTLGANPHAVTKGGKPRCTQRAIRGTRSWRASWCATSDSMPTRSTTRATRRCSGPA